MKNGGDRTNTDNLCLYPSSLKERRLFADGKFFHEDGKAIFLFDAPRPVAEPPDKEFPFVLLTGRGASAQWHTNTRTEKSGVLRKLYPANAYVEINPADAARLGIAPNSRVSVISRRAKVECTAFVTASPRTGQVFIPMHYGTRVYDYLLSEEEFLDEQDEKRVKKFKTNERIWVATRDGRVLGTVTSVVRTGGRGVP